MMKVGGVRGWEQSYSLQYSKQETGGDLGRDIKAGFSGACTGEVYIAKLKCTKPKSSSSIFIPQLDISGLETANVQQLQL